MAWKPKAVAGGGDWGARGKSRVLINKDRKLVQVQMETKEGKKKFTVKAENCPDAVQEWFKTGIPSHDFMVSMNSDEDGIFGIYPTDGMFIGKFQSFAAREGEKPAPKLVETDKYSFQTFTALVEIVEKKGYTGMIVPISLSYHFQGIEDEIQGKTYTVVAYSKPKSRFTQQLMEFMEVVGAWESGKPMKYSDNILPWLEKRILDANKKFSFVLKNGRLNTVFSLDGLTGENNFDRDEPEEDVFEETQEERAENLGAEIEEDEEDIFQLEADVISGKKPTEIEEEGDIFEETTSEVINFDEDEELPWDD